MLISLKNYVLYNYFFSIEYITFIIISFIYERIIIETEKVCKS